MSNPHQRLEDAMRLITALNAGLEASRELVQEIKDSLQDLTTRPIEQQVATIRALNALRASSAPDSFTYTAVTIILETPDLQEAVQAASITA